MVLVMWNVHQVLAPIDGDISGDAMDFTSATDRVEGSPDRVFSGPSANHLPVQRPSSVAVAELQWLTPALRRHVKISGAQRSIGNPRVMAGSP